MSKMWRVGIVVLGTLWNCAKTVNTTPAGPVSLAEGTVTVAYNAGETSMIITASVNWTLTTEATWIKPVSTSGKASTSPVKVRFVVEDNEGYAARKGTVVIRGTGVEEPYTFTIIQNPHNEIAGVNKWIYDEMGEHYYWNEEVKVTAPPAATLAYDAFLQQLVENMPLTKTQDTRETPPTIDGHWNTTWTEREYIYSTVEHTGGTRADGIEQSFGFGVMRVSLAGGGYNYLVAWTQPGGQAEAAGLKRGMRIVRYGGETITTARDEQFRNRLNAGIGTLEFTLADGTNYSIAAAETVMKPILAEKMITTAGGKKVAYMAYKQFEWGPEQTFHDDLRAAFGRMAGAQEMVLDLRYNPGGYVETSRIMVGLIANAKKNDTFAKLLRSETNPDAKRLKNPQTIYVSEEANSLRRKKLYVLATGNTASAAEMVIHSLRGFYGEEAVVIIGTRTNGKNVGMDQIEGTDDATGYVLWPITFKTLNAKGESNYAGGFAPTVYVEEARDAVNGGYLYELGDVNERLLRTALVMIDGGTPTADATSRTKEELLPTLAPVTRGGGAKYVE